MPLKCHILLVEDEPVVLETITAALNDQYLVSAAATVADAVRHLRETEFSVALVDCLLPNGNAAEIIAAAEARSVPAILMSGDPRQAEIYSAGGQPFLTKPFSLEELQKTLEAVLS